MKQLKEHIFEISILDALVFEGLEFRNIVEKYVNNNKHVWYVKLIFNKYCRKYKLNIFDFNDEIIKKKSNKILKHIKELTKKLDLAERDFLKQHKCKKICDNCFNIQLKIFNNYYNSYIFGFIDLQRKLLKG